MTGTQAMEPGAGMTVRTALYRIYDDADGLLYIRISKHFGIRWQKHSSVQPWWPQVRRQTVYWYDSRDEALDAEALAIFTEQPQHNVMHRKQALRLRRMQRRKSAPFKLPVHPAHKPPATTITLGPGVTQELLDYMDAIDRIVPDTATVRPGFGVGAFMDYEP